MSNLSSLLIDIKKKDLNRSGKPFEHFCKWYLLNDPYWKTQVSNIWLWDDWPDKWGIDKGIDLVFLSKKGEFWAVQAKNYDETHYITKKDIDTFLSESNRPKIKKRLLIATTNKIGNNAIETMKGQEKPVTTILRHTLMESSINCPRKFDDLKKTTKRKENNKARPYQKKALSAVTKGFKNNNKGQLIMACGTGKTYVTLWIKEKLQANITLVLVPSLNLLSQTLKEWTANSKKSFDVLCVCSDRSVGKTSEDDIKISDCSFDVTSNIKDISNFLQNNSDRVIFSTYQSLDLVSKAQKNKVIDLIICDEAHRCVGNKDSIFSKVCDEKFIKANKRLYTTATPKIFSNQVKKAFDVGGIELYDMSNKDIFGEVFFKYSFSEAIKDNWLTDYEAVICGVTESRIKEYIKQRNFIKYKDDFRSDAETLAILIATIKAIGKYDLKRLISFHSRVKGSKNFSSDFSQLMTCLENKHMPKGNIWSDYVSGTMKTSERTQKLEKLKKLTNIDRGILSNARCLSEGVDVPALDGVVFVDPKESQIDIIQSVGRALRKSDNKKKGIIFIPVFVDENSDIEDMLDISRYKKIWGIIKALRCHDEELGEEIDSYRTQLGERGKSRNGGISKIIFDLPKNIDSSFAKSLEIITVEQTSESWEFWYGLLLSYIEDNGHAWVPQETTFVRDKNIYRLGAWVGIQRQRYNKGTLDKERLEKLNELKKHNWVWNPIEEKWLIGLEYLKKHIKIFGHALVKYHYKDPDDGYALGKWVHKQRINRDSMPNEHSAITRETIVTRNKILENIHETWSWGRNEDAWQKNYNLLLKYVAEYGNSNVSKDFIYKIDKKNYKLGSWVRSQRQQYQALRKKGKEYPEKRKELLEKIKGWLWDGRQQELHPNSELYKIENASLTLKQICKKYNLPLTTVRNRLNYGWSMQKIVSTPRREATLIKIDKKEMTYKEAIKYIGISDSVFHRLIKLKYTGQKIKDICHALKNNKKIYCDKCGTIIKSTGDLYHHYHVCKGKNRPHPNAKKYSYKGKKQTLREIANIVSIDYKTLLGRVSGKKIPLLKAIKMGDSNKGKKINIQNKNYSVSEFLSKFNITLKQYYNNYKKMTPEQIVKEFGRKN